MIKKFPIRFTLGLLLFLYSTFSYFINTDYDMYIFFTCLIIYLFMFFDFFYQIYKSSLKAFKDKERNYLSGFYFLILLVVIIKPTGIINFDKLDSKTILTAFQEGTASCTITLKLKENNTYRYNSICFGSNTKLGKYTKKNDTIFFDKNDDLQFSYGVIHQNRLELFYKKPTKRESYSMMIINQ